MEKIDRLPRPSVFRDLHKFKDGEIDREVFLEIAGQYCLSILHMVFLRHHPEAKCYLRDEPNSTKCKYLIRTMNQRQPLLKGEVYKAIGTSMRRRQEYYLSVGMVN